MKKLLSTLCFLLFSTALMAIDVQPVDDSSAFCDASTCVTSYSYMNTLSHRAIAQQAIIDAMYLENRDLKAKLNREETTPFEVSSKEWSWRVNQELHIINNALVNRIILLENSCSNSK